MVKKRQKTRRKRQKCQQNHGFGNLNPLQGLYALTGQLGRIHVYTCPILGRFTPCFGHFLPLFDDFWTPKSLFGGWFTRLDSAGEYPVATAAGAGRAIKGWPKAWFGRSKPRQPPLIYSSLIVLVY